MPGSGIYLGLISLNILEENCKRQLSLWGLAALALLLIIIVKVERFSSPLLPVIGAIA